jgi:hypothetical protein
MTSDDISRAERFKRNTALETLLHELNTALIPAEEKLLAEVTTTYPLIFVVGPLRSGSTLMMQWLARSGQIAYPSNLLSRFYQAPIVGAKIQQLLTDPAYQFRDELTDLVSQVGTASDNGKTSGTLSPNEFWYFWRRFLPFAQLDYLPTAQLLQQVDTGMLVQELLGVAQVFAKPLALKGMILNHNIDFLSSLFEKVIFIQTKRDPAANMASILDARLRQYGDTKQWYSFKGPEYAELAALEPEWQVAGQVYHINQAVDKAMAALPAHKKLVVSYEDFCRDPASYYQQLRTKLKYYDVELAASYSGDTAFKQSRAAGELTRLRDIYQGYQASKRD